MDGKTTNVPSGASNKKKPVPTTQGRKELKTKNNVDIAEDLENFTGREGYVVVANYGMAEFIHNTVKEAENAGDASTGTGKNSASKLGPTGKIDTGMLVIALRNDEVATIAVKDDKKKEKAETSKDDREEK